MGERELLLSRGDRLLERLECLFLLGDLLLEREDRLGDLGMLLDLGLDDRLKRHVKFNAHAYELGSKVSWFCASIRAHHIEMYMCTYIVQYSVNEGTGSALFMVIASSRSCTGVGPYRYLRTVH